MKRTASVLAILLLLPVLLVFSVSANGPSPYPTFMVALENYPQEACYIDLLVQLSPDDADYTENIDNFPDPAWAGTQIFSYNEDGYVSYTFHYCGAQPNIKMKNGQVEFFKRSEENLKRFQSVKIAVLDEKGCVLQVSEPFDPDPTMLMAMNLGYAQYNYEADVVEVPNHSHVALSLTILGIYILISLLGIVATVLIEWLISCCFIPLFQYTKVVVLTNLITQLALRILFVLLYSFVLQNYILWTLLLEVAVYVSEYLIYCKRMPTASKKTILIYVILANTITLLLGLGINYIL